MVSSVSVIRTAVPVVLVLGLLAVGCSQVGSSSIRTGGYVPPYQGIVTLRATEIPPSATALGPVEAYGTGAELSAVMEEFASQVATLGGDFGKIDRMGVRFEVVTTTRTETYPCGNTQCTRVVPTAIEVGTTFLQGRAFRYGGAP